MSVRPGKKKEGKTVFDMRVQCSSIRVSRTVPTTLLSINHPGKFFENKGLTEITLQDLIDYRSMRLQTVKHATINREHTCLLTMA